MAISRETARKRAAWARIGAGVLLLCAGAVAAIPVASPAADQPSGAPSQPAKPTDEPRTAGPATGSIDVLGIASTLDAVGLARVAPASAPPPTGPEVKSPGTDDQTPANGDWKYVGSIVGPRATHAMVSVGGKQKLVAPGDVHDGIRLMSVDQEQLVIDDHGTMKTVRLEAREKKVPDAQTGRSAGRPGGPPLPAAPPVEELERIQQQRAEEQLRRMKDLEAAQQPPAGQPMRPAPLPTDAAPAGPKRGAPIKGVGAGGRN